MNTQRQLRWIEAILEVLEGWGEPLLKTEVVLLVDGANYSYLMGLLDGLCFGGFIRYDRSDDDERLCWVSITDKGRKYIEIPF